MQHAQRAPHRSSVERAESPPGIAVVGIVGVGRGRRDKKERGMAVGSVGSQDLPLPDALFSADATSPGRCLLLGDGEKLLSLR